MYNNITYKLAIVIIKILGPVYWWASDYYHLYTDTCCLTPEDLDD